MTPVHILIRILPCPCTLGSPWLSFDQGFVNAIKDSSTKLRCCRLKHTSPSLLNVSNYILLLHSA